GAVRRRRGPLRAVAPTGVGALERQLRLLCPAAARVPCQRRPRGHRRERDSTQQCPLAHGLLPFVCVSDMPESEFAAGSATPAYSERIFLILVMPFSASLSLDANDSRA